MSDSLNCRVCRARGDAMCVCAKFTTSSPNDSGAPDVIASRDELFCGCLVKWLHKPRGGYGYTVPVPAKVLAVRRTSITIAARTKDGREVTRHVPFESLRWTDETAHARHGARSRS